MYLNLVSIPNKIKPIKKLLEMNNLGLGWKRIYSLYPERDNTHIGHGYTRAELQESFSKCLLFKYTNFGFVSTAK
jgi:hypothetical protein